MIQLESPEACADAIVARIGPDIRLAAPLAAGKPNHLINALYRRVRSDPELRLTILTALTLEKPKGNSDLERRFLGPFADRVFGNYPDLDYELDRRSGNLASNVQVIEFYFPAGKFVDNPQAQRDYIGTNFTHVARDVLDRGVNAVVAQVGVRGEGDARMFSLSCNADVAVDVMWQLRQREGAGTPVAFAAQVNRDLPYMFGDAELDPDTFHFVVDRSDQDYRVFGPPKMPVDDAEYMVGLHVSALVRDGGELQVGIGALGDSVVCGLQLRHKQNDLYRRVLDDLGIVGKFNSEIEQIGGLAPMSEGLFAASEMMVDGFLTLFNEGILRRRVYDDVPIQGLLNRGRITESVTPATLDELLRIHAIEPRLTAENVQYLRYFGVFHDGVQLHKDRLVTPDGLELSADIGDLPQRQAVGDACLGGHLKHGAVIHAGFFLGPQSFYRGLRDMPEDRRRLIQMRSVRKINQLYGHEEIDRLHRKDARFVNTTMYMTALGAAASETLHDGRVVSGVGGQYNFVAMAHEIPGGRSVLNLRSTRQSAAETSSAIVWNYGQCTIPRHLRDVVVTEYGIAMLRGKTDEECVQAMLNLCDSRFQPALLAEAKRAGKLASNYQIPEPFRNNFPDRYENVLAGYKRQGLFAAFPFGCEFTEIELVLAKTLRALKARTATRFGKLSAIASAIFAGSPAADVAPYLERMGLDRPANAEERLYQRLLTVELRNVLGA